MAELNQRLKFSDRRTRDWHNSTNEALAVESTSRRTETARLDTMLRDFAVGGLQLEGFGLMSLLLSVPVGLFSKEIDAFGYALLVVVGVLRPNLPFSQRGSSRRSHLFASPVRSRASVHHLTYGVGPVAATTSGSCL